jgi:hypothetical protein
MNTFTDLEPKAACVVQCNEGTFFEKEKMSGLFVSITIERI